VLVGGVAQKRFSAILGTIIFGVSGDNPVVTYCVRRLAANRIFHLLEKGI